jgi:hypothetical protein
MKTQLSFSRSHRECYALFEHDPSLRSAETVGTSKLTSETPL